MGKVDTTLFTKKIGNDLFVLQIYVDDIIFGSTNCWHFLAQSPSEEVLSPSLAMAQEISVGIS